MFTEKQGSTPGSHRLVAESCDRHVRLMQHTCLAAMEFGLGVAVHASKSPDKASVLRQPGHPLPR